MAEKKNSTPTLRRWESPSYRAAHYAVERKKKVHIRGQKDSQQLTEYLCSRRRWKYSSKIHL